MKKVGLVLQIAATYIGTVVGAGFATGREIVEFFVSSGLWGLFGILICGVCFIFIGIKIMQISHRMDIRNYEQFNTYLFGNKVGKVVNVLFLITLLGATSVMVSGVGATFSEQLGFPRNIGILLVSILCFFIILKGVKGIFTVNSFIVPIMIGFSLTIFLLTLITKEPITVSLFYLGHHNKPFYGKLILDALIYASYNLVMAEVILVPLGSEVKDESFLKWGGTLGGLGLSLVLITSFFVLIQLPNVEKFNIPMAESVKSFGLYLHFFYILVVFGEIFSTVVGNVFGLTLQLKEWMKIPLAVLIISILGICILLSQFNFGTLLALFYRLFGALGLLIFFYLIYLPLPKKRSS